KNGTLNYEDQKQITEPGSTFSLIPLAFRVFEAPLFTGKTRDWFEVFFLNLSGQLCGLLFHSSSVDRLQQAVSKDLYYDELGILDCILTVRPIPRTHPEHGPYYVADFLFDELPAAAKEKAQLIREHLPAIYREDTVSHPDAFKLHAGYRAPDFAAETTQLPERAIAQ
ncbi:MAG: hypothetical protein AAFN92_21775, partial [Bacteroidota bacterium]